jgi:hypothetical protein
MKFNIDVYSKEEKKFARQQFKLFKANYNNKRNILLDKIFNNKITVIGY